MKRKLNTPRKRRSDVQGMALIFVVSMIVVLSVLFADLSEETTMSYVSATATRDAYQAELLAGSMLDLSRLLVALEPQINAAVAPIMQLLLGDKKIPQLAVWKYGSMLVTPFCRPPVLSTDADTQTQDWDGDCNVVGVAENSKLNVNLKLTLAATPAAKDQLANQLFALMNGDQNPSVYDPLFQKADPDGNFTTRQDIVSGIIDWCDVDNNRDSLDLTTRKVSTSGGEDDIYNRFDEPYRIKNAPLDSLQELHLIRGIGEDFWANFVEPEAGDPESRRLTIYGGGNVNINEAPPYVLLTTLCSVSRTLPLCIDPAQGVAFVAVLSAMRQLYSAIFYVPMFSATKDFFDFVEGKGDDESAYKMASTLFPPSSGIAFAPVAIPDADKQILTTMLTETSRIINFQSEVRVHNARARIDSVVSFVREWTPPPPNAGNMPPMGVFYYYRVQ